MNDLELCKAFAELEGVELCRGKYKAIELAESLAILPPAISKDEFCDGLKTNCSHEYNPITDLALNCAARDKCRAEVSFEYECVEIETGKETPAHGDCWIGFNSATDIPRAVIQCILKSRGVI